MASRSRGREQRRHGALLRRTWDERYWRRKAEGESNPETRKQYASNADRALSEVVTLKERLRLPAGKP